jgi:hypothetical protein
MNGRFTPYKTLHTSTRSNFWQISAELYFLSLSLFYVFVHSVIMTFELVKGGSRGGTERFTGS